MPRIPLFILALLSTCLAFVPSTNLPAAKTLVASPIYSTNEPDQETKPTLEDKMKSWEASDEEIRAASLGGVVPNRSDAFDVGLYILFPIMVVGLGLFAFFPILVQNIDVSSVGPPPTS